VKAPDRTSKLSFMLHYWTRQDSHERNYLALFLEGIDDQSPDKISLRTTLLLACSMSEVIHIMLPLGSVSLSLIDSIFDGLIKASTRQNCSLHRNFVVNSKGIRYTHDLPADEKEYLLKCATFVLTTDCRIRKISLENRIPNAYISLKHDGGLEMSISYLERIGDERLRLELSRCMDLIINDRCLATNIAIKLHESNMCENVSMAWG
jgi:hypothetical protein